VEVEVVGFLEAHHPICLLPPSPPEISWRRGRGSGRKSQPAAKGEGKQATSAEGSSQAERGEALTHQGFCVLARDASVRPFWPSLRTVRRLLTADALIMAARPPI